MAKTKRTGPRWGEPQRNRCKTQCDLFETTEGKEGWDPSDLSDEYIKDKLKDDDVCRPFVHKNLGGYKTNTDSSKAITNYKRAACEWFVVQAKKGNRRKDLFCGKAKYQEDKAMGGKRKSKATPAKATPSKAKAADDDDDEKKDADMADATGEDVDHDDVDELAEAIRKSLGIRTYFLRDRKQGFPIVVWAWTDGATKITYITIRIQVLGTTLAGDIKPKILEDGWLVRVRIFFPEGGEETNPEHVLKLNNNQVTENDPIYTSLATAHRVLAEKEDEDEEEADDKLELFIKMPFQVKTEGFYNPFRGAPDDRVSLGVFPLDNVKYPRDLIGRKPAPSAKFLHLHCQEMHTPKVDQFVDEEDHFG